MKFFKKLSNTNSSSSGPKLPFLKTNKKDKSTKTQVETSTPEQTDDWLDLNLPNDFSSSLNIPDFENKHSQEQNDNNTTLNTLIDAPETLKTDFSGHHQHVLDKKQTTIIPDQPLWTGNQRELDSKKDETVDTPLPSLSLTAKQEDISITEVNGTQKKPVEILGPKSEDCDWNESSTENSHEYGEIRKEKERECHEKTEIQSPEEEIKADTKTSLLQTQDLKEKNNQTDTKEEIALLSNSADTTTTNNSYVQSETAQTESNQYTPQSQLGTELSTSHEQEDKDKNKLENSTESKNNKVHSEIKSPNANRKKGVDKRLSAQSFIPRKQVIKEEDEKKPEIKDRKRQQTNGYANTTSSIPILSSGAANNNKLIITTTVVLDSNEYYYVPATNSSPSSTTSTSTTVTNTSANSNTKTQKQKTQQHSKIPVASNLTLSASSSTSRACSSQAAQHPISRLPKKINKT